MTAQQLKNSILQMAVQGKLVPQDPNDEPASVLIEKIRKEKQALIKAGKIKPEKNSSTIFRGDDNLFYEKVGNEIRCIADEIPFDIPDSWEWCKVKDLFTHMSGLAYKKSSLEIKGESMVRVLRGGNIGDKKYYFKHDDIMISSDFVKSELYLRKNYMITPAVSSIEHIGKIALIEQDYYNVVVGGFVLMLIPFFNNDVVSKYLLYAFATKSHRDNCRSITNKSGQAFFNLSREKLMNLPVALPPFEEMIRIVKRLDVIMPIIKTYEKAEQNLLNLNKAFPDRLKKSILQYAVQGKLVPQDPNDEPASVLLERIRAEKARLIKEGKIKKDKYESIIFKKDNSYYEKVNDIERCIDDEIPFDIPDSWEWCRLNSILLNNIGGGTPSKSKPGYWNGSIPWASVKDLPNGDILLRSTIDSITQQGLKNSSSNLIPKGNVIICTRMGLGKIVITEIDVAINQDLRGLFLPDYIDKLFFVFFYKTVTIKGQGLTVKGITLNMINKILVPLPPLAEQHRIVAKVEEIKQSIKKI